MAFKRRLKFDKRIKHKKRMDRLFILVIVCFAFLGIGYSYISTNLNINGTANVTAASWDVHFDNLNVTDGSVTATTPANITSDTTVEFAATLEEPGDFYEFTVDVVNSGTMDAMIDDFGISPELTANQQKYLEYTVAYSDGVELEDKQELKVGTTETLKVRFSYIENEDKTNYPTEDQTFTIEFTVSYTQADGSEIEIDHSITRYTISSNSTYIGQAIPSNITQYSSASDAMAAFYNNPFYLKHVIRNGVIDESYVEFVVTTAMASSNPGMTAGTYALQGEKTYDSDTGAYLYAEDYISQYYESNKATLIEAFGSSNCDDEYVESNYKSFSCSVSGLTANANSFGYVTAGGGDWICRVYYDGTSLCSRYE